ncbi:unnamed protein product [Porites evermanni]|uniref:Fibrinogen C-terminal domain-containing protein n=1 Tax=Porites evermanni TaxID=104178 RepID=A0ABN8SVZ4_9CNID|nr:unnamed protein product [Porites evermanni]
MADNHLQFCDGKDWVQILDKKLNQNSQETPGIDCQDVLSRGQSRGDGMYWLDPDGGSHSNTFIAYCDMTSYNGGWTMCYTPVHDEYAKPSTEVEYNALFPYGTDGYRTNCNNIEFTEIIFVDHKTGNKAYFKQKTNLTTIRAAGNYGKQADTYGLWKGFGTINNLYSYQLLICDTSFYTGFFVSGYTNCYKQCNHWCLITNRHTSAQQLPGRFTRVWPLIPMVPDLSAPD